MASMALVWGQVTDRLRQYKVTSTTVIRKINNGLGKPLTIHMASQLYRKVEFCILNNVAIMTETRIIIGSIIMEICSHTI